MNKLIYVEWLDHWDRTDGSWVNLTDITDNIEMIKPQKMKTVGWIVAETKDVLLLSADLDTGATDGHEKSRHEMAILKNCITKRKTLSI